MFLETERLMLRKWEENDFADFCAYAMDEEMSRMIGRRILHTEEDARASFDWLKDKEERGYALVLKGTGRVIGNLTIDSVQERLANLPELRGKRGVGMSFAISRQYQRQGLMSEAVKAVVEELFDCEGFEYIQCGYFSFNTASAKLQEKLGFTHLITLPKPDDPEIITVENVLWRK
ncbi:MAG: GNAT family N-acetyltransferase [Oscillospiraceae bacterium]|nr:GNAT family N-acetyltransferase [Oscillospiraceae bacterium]